MPKKICNQVGCDTLIPMVETYCDAHRKDVSREKNKRYDEKSRNKEHAKFYKSAAWRKLREKIMQEHGGLCLRCKRLDMIVKADVIDHIVPIEVKWDLRLAPLNLQPLCHSHHAKKTAEDKIKHGEGA